jgi:hypothetical protein
MLSIARPTKVSRDSTAQVLPASVERATPKPRSPSNPKLLVLPVPANKMLGFTGLSASDLIDKAGNRLSVSGDQLGLSAVALVVFQTPPLTVPT